MTGVVINPGTGPVWSGAGSVLRRHADRNMRALCRDIGEGLSFTRAGDVDDRGRYPYWLHRGKHKVAVDMPGLRLERVRITKDDGQNAWDFPRLYVDGNSWLWYFAVGQAKDALRIPRE